MSLYSYTKAPITKKKPPKETNKKTYGVPLSASLSNSWHKTINTFESVQLTSLIVPLLFIISGLSILFAQLKPYAVHFVQARFSNKFDQEVISLVPESYESLRLDYVSDPGGKYFTNILQESNHFFNNDPISASYQGKFYLTIDNIELYNAPVIANVASSDPTIYSQALDYGLAHFEGTRIPCIDIEEKPYGNTFVYGHSAAGDYAEKNPWDVTTAFTNLFKLNIGDQIKVNVEHNGEQKQCSYTVSKIKEIEPENADVLKDKPNLTLTLMTCSPPGLDSKRLIIVANQN